MKIREKRRRSNTPEHGVTLITTLFLIIIMLIMCTLIIDLPIVYLAAREAQLTADSSALAGVSQLDGSNAGWRRAKRAAFLALRANTIYGVDPTFQRADQFGTIIATYEPDPMGIEDDPNYRATSYRIENLIVLIERGRYWRPTTSDPYRFSSLEALGPGTVQDGDYGVASGCPAPTGCDPTRVANAVRVKLTITGFTQFFGQLLPGRPMIDRISRTAVSAQSDFVGPQDY